MTSDNCTYTIKKNKYWKNEKKKKKIKIEKSNNLYKGKKMCKKYPKTKKKKSIVII